MKIPDAKLSTWATVLIAVLPLFTLFGTVIWYEATTASNVAHCMHAIESHEEWLKSIDKNVASINGFLHGQREPAPKDQLTAK